MTLSSHKLKSRTFRRIKVKTPGGKSKVSYKRRKPAKHSCGDCGMSLLGVVRGIPSKLRHMPKSMKRPERPYGGNLCSPCSRKKIISEFKEGE